jgi:citrate lyase subunit beta / citryl-CoA lyase
VRVRSLLFMPGNKPAMIAKIPGIVPDAAVVDLEDAVSPADKDTARGLAVRALRELDPGRAVPLVRINPSGTPWHAADLDALSELDGVGVVLPKYEDPAQVAALRQRLGGVPVVVGLESALGVARCRELLRGPVDAVYFGAEDYIADVGGRRTPGSAEVLYPRSEVLLAAHLAGVTAIDQAVVAIRDDEAFRADAAAGRDLGYTGKICVHPRQVELAHEAFTPTAAEVAHARAVVEAFAAGAAVVDGQMVDDVHVKMAHRVLDLAGEAG